MTTVHATRSAAPLEVERHPSEFSRLLLALSATTIVFGGAGVLVVGSAGWIALAPLAGFLIVFAGAVWAGLQVYRARMLGNCIRVTPETIPELHSVLEEVRARLDYHRRVDVCVVQNANPPAQLTSYLGTKVIVLEGSLVADLLPPEERAQVTFLLARYIGALKARHERLTIVFVVLELVTSLKFLFPFLLPYRRATTYSGDQIGQRCCGDLNAALAATERLLVGKELEPEVRADGVIRQAALVRRRVLPRLAQLFQAEPHLTNRYLNLLFSVRRTEPETWEEFCDSADRDTYSELARLWQRSPHRRPASPPARRAVAAAVSAVVCAAVVVGIGLALPSPQEEEVFVPTTDTGVLTVPTPEATLPPPAETPAPSATDHSDVAELKEHVPADFRDSCDRAAAGAAIAAVECIPLSDPSPDTARYFQFGEATTMDAEFDAYAADLEARDCPDAQVTWTAGASGGRVACYTDAIGVDYVVWTDESQLILGYAETILIGPGELHQWWSDDSGPV